MLKLELGSCLLLTAKDGGSKLRSIGFITIRTCWFLWVRPLGSLRAALQKYWTHPCFPRKVEGSPSGRPNLKGKLWIPGERMTGPCPAKTIEKFWLKLVHFCFFQIFNGQNVRHYLARPGASFENLCSFLCRMSSHVVVPWALQPLHPPRESVNLKLSKI